MDILTPILAFLDKNILWMLFVFIFALGSRVKAEWVTSIRSIITALFGIMFVQLALMGKIEPKDVMLIMSLVINFYFLVKGRPNGNEVK